MTKIIERNTTIPVEKKQIFSTAADNQPAVEIHVLQGEREMAADNKTLGRFVLDGIPPAPRGVPQVEVTFAIDANGILNVAAVDKATGKEQKITITASTGLTDDEIEKMVDEAAKNAKADKEKREMAEARNEADSLIFNTEKLLKDLGEKVDKEMKEDTEKKIAEVKKLLENETVELEDLKKQTEELTEVVQKLSEKLYAEAAKEEEAKKAEEKGKEKDGDKDKVKDESGKKDGKKNDKDDKGDEAEAQEAEVVE